MEVFLIRMVGQFGLCSKTHQLYLLQCILYNKAVTEKTFLSIALI